MSPWASSPSSPRCSPWVRGPAGAATKNPCKVLTKGEIAQAFGGTVGSAKKGLSTPVSTQCEYKLGASADRPDGTVIVHLMTTGAKRRLHRA